MASLRSPLAKGFRAAFAGGADDVGSIIKERRALKEQKRQEQVALERQMILQDQRHQQALELADAAAGRSRATTNAAGMQGLFDEVSEAGSDPTKVPSSQSLFSRAQGFGQSDPAYPGAGAQINLPGRGMSTVTAHPIRPASERTPIEELLRARDQQQENAFAAKREAQTIADNKIPRIDPQRQVSGVKDSQGNFLPQERDALMQGDYEAGVENVREAATFPGILNRLSQELPLRAQYQPQLLTGQGPGGVPQFSTLTPGQSAATPVTGITPRPPVGATGTGTNTPRAQAARAQLANFMKLSSQINTLDGPGQILKGGMDWLGSAARTNKVAEEFGRARGTLASTLTAHVSGAQASDAERRTFQDALAGWTTTRSVAKNLHRTLAEMVGLADQGQTMTVPEMINFVNQRLADPTQIQSGNAQVEGATIVDFESLMRGAQ